MSNFCIGILLLLLPVLLQGQSWSTRKLSIEDGLPSNLAYTVLQDNAGYIWMATENGICRYDGDEFKTYNSPLIKNSEMIRAKMVWGKVWFLNFAGRLFYIEDDQVNWFNPDGMMEKKAVMNWLEDDFGNLYVVVEKPKGEGKLLVFQRGEKGVTLNNTIELIPDDRKAFLQDLARNKEGVWLINKNKVFLHRNGTDSLLLYNSPSISIEGVSPLHDGAIFLSKMEVLDFFRCDFEQCWTGRLNIIGEKPLTMLNLFQDSKRRIWSYGGQLILMDSCFQILGNFSSIVEGQRVNAVGEDRAGNFWISTNGGGVHVLKGKPITQFRKDNSILPQNYVYGITGDGDGNVFVASQLGWLTLIKGREIIDTIRIDNYNFEIYDVLSYENGHVWVSFKELYLYSIENGRLNKKDKFDWMNVKGMTREKNTLLFSCGEFFYVLEESGLFYRTNVGNNVYCAVMENDRVLLGTTKGVYSLTLDTTVSSKKDSLNENVFRQKFAEVIDEFGIQRVIDKDNSKVERKYFKDSLVIDYYIADMQKALDGTLWIATRSNGVYQVKDNAIVHHYLEGEMGLSSNICNNLFIDEENAVWLSTNKGLNWIDPENHTVRKISMEDGLASDYVTDVYKLDSMLYVGTSEGVSLFEMKDFKDMAPPPKVILRDIKINEQAYPIGKENMLDWNKNSLYIGFVALYYQGKITYKYRLKGLFEEWVNTEENQVRFPELAKGKYTFEVKSVSASGVDSEMITQLSFQIKPHPLRSYIAFSLYFFIAIGLVVWRIRHITQREREKTRINKKFAELELEALQAQMNPHFVFNAMNAIQNYIAQQEIDLANDYLSEFGKLMRLFLESTRKKFIYLEEEIELLQHYLRLEKLRFRDHFDVVFELGEGLETDLEIPSLLLQPFIENAINHGLAYKEDKGCLMIKFWQLESSIKVLIEDDGIGRAKALEIKRQSDKPYKSRGMQIVEDRLTTLEYTQGCKVNINVTDLINEEGLAKGTRVEVEIPFFD